MLPPLMCDEGSTGMTATLLFFFMSFMPRFSMNVDLPAPRGEKRRNDQSNERGSK